MTARLRNIAPPALPTAEGVYQRRWHDQFSSVLRLFFSNVSNAVNGLINTKLDGVDNGWRDMVGQAIAPVGGVTVPTWTQIGSGPFYGWKFAINDQLWFYYHIQHDYSPGTPIYLHSHWISDGTNVQPVKWEFTWSFARGFNQGATSTYDTTGTVVTAQEAGAGVAYRHMTTEITTPISSTNFEVDGILLTRLRRVTNGGTENTDKVWLVMADCHYQSNTFNTKNRTPNFYD